MYSERVKIYVTTTNGNHYSKVEVIHSDGSYHAENHAVNNIISLAWDTDSIDVDWCYI